MKFYNFEKLLIEFYRYFANVLLKISKKFKIFICMGFEDGTPEASEWKHGNMQFFDNVHGNFAIFKNCFSNFIEYFSRKIGKNF